MSWFVVDDQAFQHPKHQALMRRGLAGDADALGAGYLWVLAGSRIKAALGDGVLDRYDLLQLVPDPDKPFRWASILVEVGLWHDSDHGCDRCPPVEPGQYAFHDWRVYYKRSGAEERLAKALQDERKDARLHAAVWERDRLPYRFKQAPEGPDEAVCAYCLRRLSHGTKRGSLRPEVDHVLPRPLGVDNLVITCRDCNREKGQRPPKAAGLTLHLTQAHEEALAARDARSHPTGSAGLRAAMMASDEGLVAQWLDDNQEGPEHLEGAAGRDLDSDCSHPERPARLGPQDDSSHPADPPASAGRPFSVLGSRTPASAGQQDPGTCSPPSGRSGPPEHVVEQAERPESPTAGRQKTPAAPSNGWSLPFSRYAGEAPAAAATGARSTTTVTSYRSSEDAPQGLPAHQGDDSHDALPTPEPGVGPDIEAPLTRTRAHAPALTGARVLAGQGRGRQGTAPAGQGPAGDGTGRVPAPPPPRARRRRRRGKRKGTQEYTPGTCLEHGDYLPCRLCRYDDLTVPLTEEAVDERIHETGA